MRYTAIFDGERSHVLLNAFSYPWRTLVLSCFEPYTPHYHDINGVRPPAKSAASGPSRPICDDAGPHCRRLLVLALEASHECTKGEEDEHMVAAPIVVLPLPVSRSCTRTPSGLKGRGIWSIYLHA